MRFLFSLKQNMEHLPGRKLLLTDNRTEAAVAAQEGAKGYLLSQQSAHSDGKLGVVGT